MEEVILVNKHDEVIGAKEKLAAHHEGLLHRAFSVIVYNSLGEMLIHKRADNKYHSGGLWTNACCSHPRINEDTSVAAKRRLLEEIGLNAQPEFLYKFIYKAELDNNLTEYEYDHVFTCTSDEIPTINPEEVQDYKYIKMDDLFEDIDRNPENYTFWFKLIISNLREDLLVAKTA